nr:MAG TPA: hypothetical protein [Bacteriophage sp.]
MQSTRLSRSNPILDRFRLSCWRLTARNCGFTTRLNSGKENSYGI